MFKVFFLKSSFRDENEFYYNLGLKIPNIKLIFLAVNV